MEAHIFEGIQGQTELSLIFLAWLDNGVGFIRPSKFVRSSNEARRNGVEHMKIVTTPGSAPLQPHIVIGYDQSVLQSSSKLIVVFH